jgi:hypothetical protein
MKEIKELFYAQEMLQSEFANLKAQMRVLTEALRLGYAIDAEDFNELKEKISLVRHTINSLTSEGREVGMVCTRQAGSVASYVLGMSGSRIGARVKSWITLTARKMRQSRLDGRIPMDLDRVRSFPKMLNPNTKSSGDPISVRMCAEPQAHSPTPKGNSGRGLLDL